VLDIFAALQTPSKHGSIERQKRREKQIEALRKASVATSNRRIAAAKQSNQASRSGWRTSLITLGLVLLLLLTFLLIYFVSATPPA
jgi:hypothetical protein